MFTLQKAAVLRITAEQDVIFILVFYGKGEHSALMCKL